MKKFKIATSGNCHMEGETFWSDDTAEQCLENYIQHNANGDVEEEEKIRKYIENGEIEIREIEIEEDESYEFLPENYIEWFEWLGEEGESVSEKIKIEKASYKGHQIKRLIAGEITNMESFDWQGTVIERNGESVSDQAYGGESNTNGTPESGSIHTYLKDFLEF